MSHRPLTYWLGTTSAGQDVYAQFVYGLRASFIVGSHRRAAWPARSG